MKLSKKTKKLAKSASLPTLSLTLAACDLSEIFPLNKKVRYVADDGSEIYREKVSGTDGTIKTYEGTALNERFIGDNSVQLIDGAGGQDVIDYSESNEGIEVYLDGTPGKGGYAAGDEIKNVENVKGSKFNDLVHGNNQANIIHGEDGNDEIHSYGGVDGIYGGSGDDVIFAGDGNDFIIGGTGKDTINGGAGSDTLGVLEMVDNPTHTINLSTGKATGGSVEGDQYFSIENIETGAKNGTIIGTNGENKITILVDGGTVQALGGNDLISAKAFANIEGGDGSDVIKVESFSNVLGGEGDDFIFGQFDTEASGGNGKDTIIAGASSEINGDDGDDNLTINQNGSTPNKTIVYGGKGNDQIVTKNIATIFGGADNDTITADYEVIANGDEGDDTINVKTFSEVNGGTGHDQIKVSNPDDAPDLDLMMIDGISGLSGHILGGAGTDKLTLEGINFDHFEIMQAENKILLHGTKENEPTKEVDILISSIETLNHNGSDINIEDIWSQLNATEQAKFNDNEAEFTTWLGQDAGFNYEGL